MDIDKQKLLETFYYLSGNIAEPDQTMQIRWLYVLKRTAFTKPFLGYPFHTRGRIVRRVQLRSNVTKLLRSKR